MTDNEIIKAFNSLLRERCDDCPFKTCYDCEMLVGRYALDLINRQQAEIERLKEYPKCVYEYDGDLTDFCLKSPCSNYKTVEQIKSEAIKEFAERLKKESGSTVMVEGDREIPGTRHYSISEISLDNLVKERLGDAE